MTRHRRGVMRRAAAWLLAAVAVLAAFPLYLRPGFLVMLADQMWACF